jgi:hypothetical protein
MQFRCESYRLGRWIAAYQRDLPAHDSPQADCYPAVPYKGETGRVGSMISCEQVAQARLRIFQVVTS